MRKIRVLVIDDSAYNRRTISRILEELPGVTVAGYARDGIEGLRQAVDLRPDLITLDLHMPTMEGFTFLRLLMHRCPAPVIVVSSQGEGDRVIQALELGAVDCVLKPEGLAAHRLTGFGDDLRRKVLNLFDLDRPEAFHLQSARETTLRPEESAEVGSQHAADVIAIGASTGGPAAIKRILASFDEPPPWTVLVAQHMPACFTRAFADRLDRLTHFEVREAQDGEDVIPGRVLIVPGGRHMALEKCGETAVVRLLAPGPDDRYLPSVDVLFRTAADVYTTRLLGVVLTGMGSDGAEGAVAIRERGGQVLAESEETAVVFGMPREAIAGGGVDQVVRLELMAHEIARRGITMREAPRRFRELTDGTR